jgi:hypothetical protein
MDDSERSDRAMPQARAAAPAPPRLGLGVLSWRGYDSLRASLESYQREDLFSLFDEALLFLPEMTADGLALANAFELPYEGARANLGILGGFKALASAMSADVLLLLENDCPLIEPRAEAARQLDLARRVVWDGEAVVFRMRHVAHPGQKFATLEKYRRYHGEGRLPALRRRLRPGKARRLAGTAVYAEAEPEAKFPELISRKPEGWLSVSAACLPWTNQSVLVRRDFYLGTIIAEAEAHPSGRTVNGFPDVEKEWNRPRWRESGWRIGVDRGLFTHERV